MLTGRRSAWRRGRRSSAARIAVPLAIPMALGLTLGVVIAVSGSHNSTRINQSALGESASAPASRGNPLANSLAADRAPSFAGGALSRHMLGDLATDPVDGTGAPISLNQTADQAAGSGNCTLIVPDHPLSARGLATPYQLSDGCSMANFANQGAFVEATILAPNGMLQVYNPLVITAGSTPAAPPVRPRIVPGSQVIIDIGFNGTNLVLQGRGARQGNCVDALGQSVIGQVAACNAVDFYRAADRMIAQGRLQVPATGVSKDGQPCPTVRDFAVIDQDQSDNVVSQYLIDGNGNTAQNTAANKAAMTGSQVITNGSDDALLSEFIDPAIGCTPFTAPDITNPNGVSPSQALNELSARVNQKAPIAVVPPNDEMTLVGMQFSLDKTNVYRSLVDQPLLPAGTDLQAVATAYCKNMVTFAPERSMLDMAAETAFGSPVPAVGSNLATFLGARLSASFGILGCGGLGQANPVTVTTDGGGVAIAVSYAHPGGGGTASPSATPSASASGAGAGSAPAPSASGSAAASPSASGDAGGGGDPSPSPSAADSSSADSGSAAGSAASP